MIFRGRGMTQPLAGLGSCRGTGIGLKQRKSGPNPYHLERPAHELSSRCHAIWHVEAVSNTCQTNGSVGIN